MKDDEEEEEEEVSRAQTRRTTRNMQVETGATIPMISSPKESRMVVGFGPRSIWFGVGS